ncbi:HalOD1 output domain-containing protein [Halobacterium bonnevillei]|uniref:Halobacterial output domain-containing protein n=1 Tax=Halobacterium bonnevillei TaxID=2692200 RepID=A0A6B0SI93_9EURY|nr:HalOD1 output domain-containing protein [Halobacterium bonnevillei]MXR21494.1 hypothetical protein [Halobacterium bonnevillei]
MARERQTVSERVIQKVATASGTDALELPPLWDAIEPDALDTLVAGMVDGEVSFAYAGYDVTVTSDETISLQERPAGDSTVEVAATEC